MFDAVKSWLNEPVGGSNSSSKSSHGQRPAGWYLEDPLVAFNNADIWTLGNACEGTMILGATGSGKTSGSGSTIAKSMLRNGFGGLVLCAKADEPELWKRYIAECGREEDLILFSKEQFNFINYETKRPGLGAGLTENIVNLFMQVVEIASQKGGKGASDDYWERATKQMLRNAVDLVKLARGQCTLGELFDVVQSAPLDNEQINSEDWKKNSVCWSYIGAAEQASSGDIEKQKDYQLAAKYWLIEFPNMDSKPRSSIVSMFTSLADSFLRGPLRKRFSEETTIVPDFTTAGKIILVDMPVKEYADLGQYAGVLMKFMTQKALERRPDIGSDQARPVFIWSDECHYFMTSYDQIFQTTARAAKGCTVYLTQNYSNLLSAMGNEVSAKAKVDSLLGNLQTKIFHQNGDPETNLWASTAIGKKIVHRTSESSGTNWSLAGGYSKSSSVSTQESMDFDCQPREFTTLRKGSGVNNFMVDSIVWQSGRIWNNSQTWLKATFNQKA